VCCGTKREVEIDCPSHCEYLRAGRSYESEKRIPDPEIAAKAYRFDEDFITRYAPVFNAISREIRSERGQSPWLVDNDVIEVFKALTSTLKTLSSGIYYESQPDGPVRQSLYRRVKSLVDELLQPRDADILGLKVSEVLDIVDFLTLSAEANSSTRPKSRRYLDLLESIEGPVSQRETGSGLILP